MIDAHVHVGWFSRKKTGLHYYSPRRVVGILDRCGVDAFIVSSTTAQAVGAKIDDVLNEAEEIRRIAGCRARIFYWLSGQFYAMDQSLGVLDTGIFDGIKLHEGEGHWVEHRWADLMRILSLVERRRLPVQFHSGPGKFCSPNTLMQFAQRFPGIHFDFAHCRPMDEMARVMALCPNVWTDVAYMDLRGMVELMGYTWFDRLMFGSDVPVWQAHDEVLLTRRYRAMRRYFLKTGLSKSSDKAFQSFIH